MPTANRQTAKSTRAKSYLADKINALPRPHDNDNPLWAGPSGIGPLGGVTQSMLGRFLDCRECFRLKYVLGLESHPKWNHRTGYGDMWHICEEAEARSLLHDDWIHDLDDHVQEQLTKYPLQHDEITKWYNVCQVQFPEYVKYWADHPDVVNRTPLMQEQVFDVPYNLPSGRVARLRGKFDSVDLIEEGCAACSGVGDEYGRCGACNNTRRTKGIYLQENKTKGDVDKLEIERQLRFDLQTMMYLVALHEMESYEDSPIPKGSPGRLAPILGVRYNVARRPLSGGVGNIRPHAEKRTKNTYTPAETSEEFYERLRRDYIADDPGHWFFRVRSEVSERDIRVFRDTCLDPLLETVCVWYEMTAGDRGFCGYAPELPPMNYRTPYGIYKSDGANEYAYYLENGSEAGLRRVESLFPELQ